MFESLSAQVASANEKRMLDDVQHVPQFAHPPKPAKPRLARLVLEEEDRAVSARAAATSTAAPAVSQQPPNVTSPVTFSGIGTSSNAHDEGGVQALVYHVHGDTQLSTTSLVVLIVACVVAFVASVGAVRHYHALSKNDSFKTRGSRGTHESPMLPFRGTQSTIDRMLRYA